MAGPRRALRRDARANRAGETGFCCSHPIAIESGLLNLKLTAFDLDRFDPEFTSYAGAIQLLDDGILIAEATGGFYKLTFEAPSSPAFSVSQHIWS
jgi:hypothetical protein